MRIDVPAEDDTPRVPPESHAAESPATDGREPSDRVAYAANYRSIVDGAYHDCYRAVTSETANLETHTVHVRGAVDASGGGNCSRTVESSENSETKLLHADADPLRIFGPASDTHPAELEAAMARLDGAGAEVDMRHGSMSYSPSAVTGQPGRLILDPEASYGAVLHEMSHFSDDEAAGFLGLRYWLEDPAVTAAGESKAYQTEIDYANSICEAGIASQLEELKAQRISQLLGENDG
jgi:hypothetical protein